MIPDGTVLNNKSNENINEATGTKTRDMGRIVLRNTLAVISGRWINKVLTFLFSILTFRLLGAVGLGQYATVIAFVGLFGVFFELGMSQYVERSIAQNRDRTQTLFWNLVTLRLLLALLGIAIITSLSFVAGHEPPVVRGVFLLTLTFILAAFLMPLTTVLRANERFDITMVIQVSNQIATIVFGSIFLLLGFGFLALIYTSFIGMPIQMIICIWALRRHRLGTLSFKVTPATWSDFVRASLPFGLTSLALTLNFNADTVILGLFHPDSTVGWYNAAYRTIFNVVQLVSGFVFVLTPSLAREHTEDPKRVHLWVRKSIEGLSLFAFPATVGLFLLAPRAIPLLYGESYLPTGHLLLLMCFDVPLLLFISLCGNVTTATGLEHPASRIYMFSTALNVAGNFLLIPWIGMYGAALMTVLTDGLSSLRFYLLLNKHMQLDQVLFKLVRIGLVALLMGVVVWLTSPLPVFIVVLIGMVSYVLLVLWLRLVEWSMLVSIARIITRRSSKALSS